MENVIGWIIIGLVVVGTIIGFIIKIYTATKIVKESSNTPEGRHQTKGWIIIGVFALIIFFVLDYLIKDL